MSKSPVGAAAEIAEFLTLTIPTPRMHNQLLAWYYSQSLLARSKG